MPKVDQRRFDNQHPEFLASAAAAKFLGVQARTLYAYASRGLVTRVKLGQRSQYRRDDLERLRARHDARAGHAAVAGAALNWGEPVLETRICQVDPAGPRYRGHLATELAARGTPFPAICALLWTGQLPTSVAAAAPGRLVAGVRVRPDRAEAPVMRLLEIAVARLRAAPAPFGLPLERELARAGALVDAFAGAAGPRRIAPGRGDPAARLCASFGLRPTPVALGLVNAALGVCADHELNASTFAARVAASTGSDLHACVVAALATFLGPRHGTASHAVELLLPRLRGPAAAEALVRERTARGEGMPGFGHPLYPAGDPRATALLALVAEAGADRRIAPLRALFAATEKLRGERPNLDAALVAVALALGLPAGAATALFAVGRTAGWIAHVLEQRESNRPLRPRARYMGARAPGEGPSGPSTSIA